MGHDFIDRKPRLSSGIADIIPFTSSRRSAIVPAMAIPRDSIHFQILERLCSLPPAVRGTSGAMLEREYGALSAVADLASAGLIRERGWYSGPGTIWVPTAEGVALYEGMVADGSKGAPKPPGPRWVRKPDE